MFEELGSWVADKSESSILNEKRENVNGVNQGQRIW